MRSLVVNIDNVHTPVYMYGSKNTGIYRFRGVSSTGKTRLYNLLNQYMVAGYNVAGYSYEEYIRKCKIKDYIGKGLKLMMIDRYDMYNGEMAEDIIKLSQECIVLIDCKSALNISETSRVVNIIMDSDKIVIK